MAPSSGGGHALAIGDFNTSRAYLDEAGAIDATAYYYMEKIERVGFCDLWRRRYPAGCEHSWLSTKRNGFRIDHAFLSQNLVVRAGIIRYSPAERLAGLSDHSPLTPRGGCLTTGINTFANECEFHSAPVECPPIGRSSGWFEPGRAWRKGDD